MVTCQVSASFLLRRTIAYPRRPLTRPIPQQWRAEHLRNDACGTRLRNAPAEMLGARDRVGRFPLIHMAPFPVFYRPLQPLASFQGVSMAKPLSTAEDLPTAEDVFDAADVIKRFAASFEPGLYSGAGREEARRHAERAQACHHLFDHACRKARRRDPHPRARRSQKSRILARRPYGRVGRIRCLDARDGQVHRGPPRDRRGLQDWKALRSTGKGDRVRGRCMSRPGRSSR